MKLIILAVLLLPACLFSAALTLTLDNTGINYNSSTNSFDLPGHNSFSYTTAPMSYRLPVRTVNIILPPNLESITGISYAKSSRQLYSGKSPELNTPYSDGEKFLTAQTRLQPDNHFIYQGLGKWGNVNYARFAILPALFDISSGYYDFADNVILTISYSTTKNKAVTVHKVPALIKTDPSFVNNNALTEWYNEGNTRNYDYLVVTTPGLYTASLNLVNFRQSQGLVTAFADITQILASTPGANPPDKLRNYLITQYTANPFSYLLLIGDIDVVPIAYLTPEPEGMETVPSDFYYSDLSSNFDSDNDGRLGEYNTGMDFTPELYVGRIPWNYAPQVQQICNRTVAYESENPAWKNKVLLPAAILNYAAEDSAGLFERTDGATFMEYVKSTVLRDKQVTTMYEQAGLQHSILSDYPLLADTLAMLLNSQNWGIVNWSAHGNPTNSARKIWVNDFNNNNLPEVPEIQWFNLVGVDTFDNLANQNGSVYFCGSCLNGEIDGISPSLGEYLLWKKAVADIAATRTGWYKIGWQNPGWGGISSYNYHFLENYARHGMTVGQAHAYTNWLHTQYCLFGDPIDSNGIIWPELQNLYTYLLYGDPAVGYPAQTNEPAAQILVWEPIGNLGSTVVNGLLDLGAFNVVYTNHLINDYNYLNQFDAVFCLFGLGYGQNVYYLTPQNFEYNYLLSYLQQGGKIYLEGMVSWDGDDPLFGRFGTVAPFDHVAMIEQLRYTNAETTQIWDYNGYNGGTQALATTGNTARPLFWSYNQQFVSDIIGIWNRMGESRTISSSFNLSGVYSTAYTFPQFLSIILDTLGVIQTPPVAIDDQTEVTVKLEVNAYPNPFRTSLAISAKSSGPVTLSIYNIKGQLVRTENLLPEKGLVQWQWNGKSENNRQLGSGIYLLKVDTAQHSRVVKILKLR